MQAAPLEPHSALSRQLESELDVVECAWCLGAGRVACGRAGSVGLRVAMGSGRERLRGVARELSDLRRSFKHKLEEDTNEHIQYLQSKFDEAQRDFLGSEAKAAQSNGLMRQELRNGLRNGTWGNQASQRMSGCA